MDVMVKKLEDMEKKLTNSYKDSEKKVSKKLEDFEATLSFYGDKIDEATKSVKAMEQKLVLMENRLDKSERENKELKTRLRNMEIQMNEIAQKQYNNQMEISGVKDKNINAEIAESHKANSPSLQLIVSTPLSDSSMVDREIYSRNLWGYTICPVKKKQNDM
ncbi:hypothetical protein M8J76_015710 [Diaphorina citri]|nr:hypothetical protein M8J76_015710 [Diaphorina citri]